ncbi:hypothetical protein BST61_g8648 [Cercospora zeina]
MENKSLYQFSLGSYSKSAGMARSTHASPRSTATVSVPSLHAIARKGVVMAESVHMPTDRDVYHRALRSLSTSASRRRWILAKAETVGWLQTLTTALRFRSSLLTAACG